MDSRAKQRLTGAIILVALFVLLVPELLPPPKDSAGIADADAEEGMRRYTIDLDAPASTGGQAAEYLGEWDFPLNKLLHKALDIYMSRR